MVARGVSKRGASGGSDEDSMRRHRKDAAQPRHGAAAARCRTPCPACLGCFWDCSDGPVIGRCL